MTFLNFHDFIFFAHFPRQYFFPRFSMTVGTLCRTWARILECSCLMIMLNDFGELHILVLVQSIQMVKSSLLSS